MSSSPVHIGKKKSAKLIRSSCLSEEGLKHTSGAWVVCSFDKCTADISVAASRGKNISSNKKDSCCSIYLSVVSDLIKTRSQHITKRKTLLIDMCDRCIQTTTMMIMMRIDRQVKAHVFLLRVW